MYDYNPDIKYIEDNSKRKGISSAQERVKWLKEVRQILIKWWQNIIDVSVKYYNEHHKPKQYNMREMIILAIKNLKQKQLSKKLSHCFIRPFKMDKIVEKQIYHLILSLNYRIHSVFYILLLESYIGRKDKSSISAKPLLKLINNNKEWEVKKILKKKKS